MNWAGRRTHTQAMAVFIGVSLGLSSGCGGSADDYDGPERVAVSGSVVVDGKDLVYGRVNFVPTNPGKQRYADGAVLAGKYSLREAKGPNLGEYKVEIIGYAKAPPEPSPDVGEDEEDEAEEEEEEDDDSVEDAEEQILPAKYNSETTLKVTIESGKSEYNFDELTLK